MGAGAPALYHSKKSIDQQQETREKGGRERGHALAKSEARDLRFNQSGESRVYVMKHTTKNKSWAGERAAAAVSER